MSFVFVKYQSNCYSIAQKERRHAFTRDALGLNQQGDAAGATSCVTSCPTDYSLLPAKPSKCNRLVNKLKIDTNKVSVAIT